MGGLIYKVKEEEIAFTLLGIVALRNLAVALIPSSLLQHVEASLSPPRRCDNKSNLSACGVDVDIFSLIAVLRVLAMNLFLSLLSAGQSKRKWLSSSFQLLHMIHELSNVLGILSLCTREFVRSKAPHLIIVRWWYPSALEISSSCAFLMSFPLLILRDLHFSPILEASVMLLNS